MRMSRWLTVIPALWFSLAFAQTYPSKPLRWIVPYAPGGSADVFTRPVAQKLGELLNQAVVVENRGGAGATIGTDALAKSAPDGYTIGLSATGSHAINPHLYPQLSYDPLKDFAPITLAISYVNILVVPSNSPIRSGADLITYAKANPGRVSYGSGGHGSSSHLFGELLKTLTGAPMQHVPYNKGNGPALLDVMAGNLTFMFDVPNAAIPQIRAGRLRGVAVGSARRTPFMPDLPTLSESGIKGFEEAGSDLWFGIMAPAGTPRNIVMRLNAALIATLRSPEIRERLRTQAFDLWTSTPEEFAAVLKSDLARWGNVVRASGAKID